MKLLCAWLLIAAIPSSAGLINISGPSSAPGAGGGSSVFGMDFSGSPSVHGQMVNTSPPAAHPLTILLKVYQRKNSARSDGSSYYTNFFWGNQGSFTWGGGYGRSYYGAHPYPSPGQGKWEISTGALDYRGINGTPNDGSGAPDVGYNAWYSQAFTAENTSGSSYRYKFYTNLPDVTATYLIDVSESTWTNPPTPALMFGETADVSGLSWGGYQQWEETNGILRGIQVYTAILTTAQINARAACETDACVLALNTADGITSLWFLNINPTPTDITDKSGHGHDFTWSGSGRPTLYTGAVIAIHGAMEAANDDCYALAA